MHVDTINVEPNVAQHEEDGRGTDYIYLVVILT